MLLAEQSLETTWFRTTLYFASQSVHVESLKCLKREAMEGEATSVNDLSIQADTESGPEAECGLIFFKSDLSWNDLKMIGERAPGAGEGPYECRTTEGLKLDVKNWFRRSALDCLVMAVVEP